jgi:organic hydroperoxide reductase OsmC/OhrA
MLWFLHLAAVAGVNVTAYRDVPRGTMRESDDGSGRFVDVVLRPEVTVASPEMADKAESLHTRAHEMCFIANSVSVPVRCEPRIVVSE